MNSSTCKSRHGLSCSKATLYVSAAYTQQRLCSYEYKQIEKDGHRQIEYDNVRSQGSSYGDAR